MNPTRPFYWSVRREVWENRSVYLAPLIVAAVVLFGSLIATITLPKQVRSLATGNPQQHSIATPMRMSPAPIMLASFIVGLFYCLDALYGERRDRSILFWKSLPVSDRTTVLAKASIPVIVLPFIAYVLSVITQAILWVFSTGILLVNSLNPAPFWRDVRFFQSLVIMFYGLMAHALWFAPIYAYLLLVSVWARRTPILWAVMPPLAIAILESIASRSSYMTSFLKYRVTGAMAVAFAKSPAAGGDVSRLSQLEPLRFLTSGGLWLGLLFAAAFLAAAIRLRRKREPI